jgi:hypothetical protein
MEGGSVLYDAHIKKIRISHRLGVAMCICSWDDIDIMDCLINESLPDEALLNSCCWRRICQVRGRNSSGVGYKRWVDLCARRGYLLYRENPRGF